MESSKFNQLRQSLQIGVPYDQPEKKFDILDNSYDRMLSIQDRPGKYCNIPEIADIFSWKKGFSYLFTGSPNAGKTTFVLFLYLLMSIKNGWRFCVWSPEMEDHEKKIGFIQKDLIYTLVWTLTGITPYEHFAKKHGTDLLKADQLKEISGWVNSHFFFIHAHTRTPDAIIEAFNAVKEKHNVDGFLLDPWKSVKQEMTMRSDLWMEDTLMTFKEFSQETETALTYIVHPKALHDYTDDDGNYRVITPFDLNGGAAWFNSMDVIASIRRLTSNSELYIQKIRKQHLVGQLGDFKNITFSTEKYRFLFNGNDPFHEKMTF